MYQDSQVILDKIFCKGSSLKCVCAHLLCGAHLMINPTHTHPLPQVNCHYTQFDTHPNYINHWIKGKIKHTKKCHKTSRPLNQGLDLSDGPDSCMKFHEESHLADIPTHTHKHRHMGAHGKMRAHTHTKTYIILIISRFTHSKKPISY